MTAKQYLSSYRDLNQVISRLQVAYEEVIAGEGSISSPLGHDGGAIGYASEAPFVHRVERELYLRSRLDSVIAERIERKVDILNKLSGLSDVSAAVLIAKYVNGYSVNEIADEKGYSPRHMWRILDDAIAEFVSKYGDDY